MERLRVMLLTWCHKHATALCRQEGLEKPSESPDIQGCHWLSDSLWGEGEGGSSADLSVCQGGRHSKHTKRCVDTENVQNICPWSFCIWVIESEVVWRKWLACIVCHEIGVKPEVLIIIICNFPYLLPNIFSTGIQWNPTSLQDQRMEPGQGILNVLGEWGGSKWTPSSIGVWAERCTSFKISVRKSYATMWHYTNKYLTTLLCKEK